jgi:hypothetical protein
MRRIKVRMAKQGQGASREVNTMAAQTMTLEALKGQSLEGLLQQVADQRVTVTVLLPDGLCLKKTFCPKKPQLAQKVKLWQLGVVGQFELGFCNMRLISLSFFRGFTDGTECTHDLLIRGVSLASLSVDDQRINGVPL